eukprot:scaffold916_cov516-Prasinococcus_capsulatus_cf.AAC.11
MMIRPDVRQDADGPGRGGCAPLRVTPAASRARRLLADASPPQQPCERGRRAGAEKNKPHDVRVAPPMCRRGGRGRGRDGHRALRV